MSTNFNHTPVSPNTMAAVNPLQWQVIFIQEYRQCKSIYKAASVAGVSRPTVYKYLKMDAHFKAEFDSAHQDAIDSLELSAFQRARDGVKKTIPMLYQGQIVATREETQYSDGLAEFFLKHLRPETYNPAQQINHTITIDETDKKLQLTQAVQFGINSGMSLQDTLNYLIMRGVSQEDLKLVNGSDLIIPDTSNAIDITCEGEENDNE